MVTLESSPPFRMLDAADLAALGKIAQERTYSSGEQIFQEGDRGDGVYLVKSGRIEISVGVTRNERRAFAQIAPGELFGEMAVLELKPRSATATAAEDSAVYFFPRNELLAMVERSPLLAMQFLREISSRLREFNQRYIQEILQAERLAVVGRFARSIVHDIKNPLNIISLTAELSGMEKADAELRKKSARTIRTQVERVSEMVSEILDFTQGSHAEVVMSAVDYGAFVQSLLEEIRSEAELKNVMLHAENIPSINLPLDPKRLRRVFFNLIHNAMDAMSAGGQIFIRFQVEPDKVITEIEDTGPGIAPEIAGRLFEVFATFGKTHGTGLGLSICKKIIEDHHGRIWPRAESGHGAVFCFTLPREKPPVAK